MAASPFRIESRQNPRFQTWLRMAENPQKAQYPWIPVEGWKQIVDLSGWAQISLLLYSDGSDPRLDAILPSCRQVVQLAPKLMQLLSGVKSPQGVMAFLEKPVWGLKDLPPCLLYLEELQDPGNLGTLLRTALATGGPGIVTSPGSVSIFNSKVVRSSTSAIFEVPFLEHKLPEELACRGYQLLAAVPDASDSLFELELKTPLAVLVGGEGSGLSEATLQMADDHFRIPMSDRCESLNASVAGSLILYELFRRGVCGAGTKQVEKRS